jgi:heat shock protein HtpX
LNESPYLDLVLGPFLIVALPAPPRIPQDQLQRMQSLVEVLSLAHGIVPPRVALTVDAAPNCLTIGRKPSTACVVMTTGMLETLNRHQLEAVLAYELARVVRGSVSLDTVVYAMTAKVFELWASAFDEIDESSLITIPLGLLCSPFVALAWALRANVLRGRAHLADGIAVSTTRNPGHLIDALRVIMDHPAIVRRSDPGAAHLWLEYPHSRWSRRILRTDRIMPLRIATLQTALNLPDHGR